MNEPPSQVMYVFLWWDDCFTANNSCCWVYTLRWCHNYTIFPEGSTSVLFFDPQVLYIFAISLQFSTATKHSNDTALECNSHFRSRENRGRYKQRAEITTQGCLQGVHCISQIDTGSLNTFSCSKKCGEKKRFRVNKADVTDDKLSKKEEERQRRSIREKKKVKKYQ